MYSRGSSTDSSRLSNRARLWISPLIGRSRQAGDASRFPAEPASCSQRVAMISTRKYASRSGTRSHLTKRSRGMFPRTRTSLRIPVSSGFGRGMGNLWETGSLCAPAPAACVSTVLVGPRQPPLSGRSSTFRAWRGGCCKSGLCDPGLSHGSVHCSGRQSRHAHASARVRRSSVWFRRACRAIGGLPCRTSVRALCAAGHRLAAQAT